MFHVKQRGSKKLLNAISFIVFREAQVRYTSSTT